MSNGVVWARGYTGSRTVPEIRLPSSGAPSEIDLLEPAPKVCGDCNTVIEGEVCRCIDGVDRCRRCWDAAQDGPEVRLGKNRYRNRPPFSPPWRQPHPTSEGSSRTPQLDLFFIAVTLAVGLPSASRSVLAGVGSRSSTASPVEAGGREFPFGVRVVFSAKAGGGKVVPATGF